MDCAVVENELPAKYSLFADGTSLTVFNVCRECVDNTTDLQVIQCNASNQHGYAFVAGYINVLRMFDGVCYGSPSPLMVYSAVGLCGNLEIYTRI